MKLLFENWRQFVKQEVEEFLPHGEVRAVEKIGSSVLPPEEQAKQDLEKYGYVRDEDDKDIDIEVQIAHITNEEAEEWAFSREAQELEDYYNYDVQLRIVENWRHYLLEDMDSDQIRKVILIDDENRLLIMKSSDMNKKHAGEWDLPGGHIHEGEDDIEGLKREVKEETTLDITNPEKIHEEGRIKFYKTSQYRGTIELSEEHTEHKWVTIQELDSYTIGAKFVKAAKVALKTDDDSETDNNL